MQFYWKRTCTEVPLDAIEQPIFKASWSIYVSACLPFYVPAVKRPCFFDFSVEILEIDGFACCTKISRSWVTCTHVQKPVFDVPHMLQTRILGKDRKQFMKQLIPVNNPEPEEQRGNPV